MSDDFKAQLLAALAAEDFAHSFPGEDPNGVTSDQPGTEPVQPAPKKPVKVQEASGW